LPHGWAANGARPGFPRHVPKRRSTQLHYNHRDASFYTDNNRGTLNAADVLNANFTFYPAAGPLSFTVYATNLLDETTFGGDTQLPNSPAFGGGVPLGSLPPPTFRR
jgi:iron complex outermembrane recepter protein